ncbi:MAG: gamma-glutamylcyclotransferase [Xanthobacteraceae bacterium]|nr:gamma-glutamylcyclotransferase [Xanthobacteraceae bacterium]QYK44799.1 MAG: gamma-glutamylcyclotransferase [Xanthobacteraceae bacterium]
MSGGDLWVFGYGSLMWRPGFDFIEQHPARLNGAHRALCVISHFHRGTAERPGLVLGLDRGGSCRGIAFRVKESLREQTIAYLREREQVTSVYLEKFRLVDLLDGARERVSAVCYLVDRGHAQYSGALTPEEQLVYVKRGHGKSGNNPDYVLATVDAMKALGIRDRGLEWIADRLKSERPFTPRDAD